MKKVRIGIIGYGRVGRRRAEMIGLCRDAELAAVADPSGRFDGVQSGCRTVLDGVSLLRERDLDAVFVCTPNSVTADLIVAALDAGKHVFAEKPPGRNLADVVKIREAELRHPSQKLKFGFNHREHESVRLVSSLLEAREMGRLMWMRGVYGKAGGPGFEQDWRCDPLEAGGGILLDQGIHMLDLFRLFGGEFEDIKSFVTNSFWQIGLEDNAFALLRGVDGVVAMLHSSATHWNHTFRLELYLTEGYLIINGFLTGTRTYGRETLVIGRRDWNDPDAARGTPREERYFFDDDRSWLREVEAFLRCVTTDEGVVHGSSYDALKAMELVTRIYCNDRQEMPR